MRTHDALDRAAMVLGAASIVSAAAVQLVLLAGGNSGFLRGNASTVSLWLGLGAALIALATVPVPDADEAP
jgi:hypothetical protein